MPTQSRRNLCAWTNGTAAKASECAYERPATIQTCNSQVKCPTCVSPQDSVLLVNETCGYGRCEKIYKQAKPWEFDERCVCLDGYEKSNDKGRCVIKTRCYANATNAKSTGWQTGSWSSCTKAAKPQTGGIRSRTVTCECINSLTGENIECNLCYDRCAKNLKPVEVEVCSYVETPSSNYSLPTNNWTKSPNLPVIDPASDFVLLEYRTTSAVFNEFKASAAACVAACKGTPTCPAATFTGHAGDGGCSLININLLQWAPLQRSNTHHLLMRKGFIKSYPQPSFVNAVKNAGNSGVWTPGLGNTVLNANENLAKAMSTIEENDPFWSWVNSVPDSNTGTTAQNVPLRKSLYSLGFPTHPNVLKHMRYLQNFLASEHDTSDIADVILAFAFKYRNYKSVTNSTSSLISQIRDGEELSQKCTFANLLTNKGETAMPLYREENPAPVGALHYLLEKLRNNASIIYPLKDSPWPLLVLLATSHFPTRECDWVWSRYDAEPDHTDFEDEKRPTKQIDTSWAYYSVAYTKSKIVCKESIWHPDALPRIPEDGGMCGRLAYIRIGNLACRGAPAAMVGQPKHAAGITYNRNAAGKWEMQKFAWIFPSFVTTFENSIPTDDVPGAVKNMFSQVDYAEALPHAMNLGLDSYIDVRLAMLLFRNVYTNEGFAYVNHLTSILLSALEKNPHNIEAWDLIFVHIRLTTITDDTLIAKAFRLFRPHANLYLKTYEKFLTAIATIYKCEASKTSGPLAFLLNEIETVAPGCSELGTRLSLKSSILPCYKTAYGVGVGILSTYEKELIQLAWNECEQIASENRSDFALADMKLEAFEQLLGMLVGSAKDQYEYGLAGVNHTATLQWLLQMLTKVPVGHIGKMLNDCTEDPLNLGGDTWAIWSRTGRISERGSHRILRKYIKKYYMILGKVEDTAKLEYDTFERLKGPLALHNQKRLTYNKAKSFGYFKKCTCAKITWSCCSSNNCDISRRLLSSPEYIHGRRLLEITPTSNVSATDLSEMKEDAESGRGVEGSAGTLASQTTVTSEDYAILGESISSYSYDPEMFIVLQENGTMAKNKITITSTVAPTQIQTTTTQIQTTTKVAEVPVANEEKIEAKFSLSVDNSDVSLADFQSIAMKNAIRNNIATTLGVSASKCKILAIFECPGDSRCSRRVRRSRMLLGAKQIVVVFEIAGTKDDVLKSYDNLQSESFTSALAPKLQASIKTNTGKTVEVKLEKPTVLKTTQTPTTTTSPYNQVAKDGDDSKQADGGNVGVIIVVIIVAFFVGCAIYFGRKYCIGGKNNKTAVVKVKNGDESGSGEIELSNANAKVVI